MGAARIGNVRYKPEALAAMAADAARRQTIPASRLQAAAAAMGRPKPPTAHVLPTPFPGVLPKDNKGMAQDGYIASAFGYAESGAFAEGITWLGYPYLAELTQRPEYRRPSEIIAKEMTRKWIKLSATGEDRKTEKLKQLEAAMIRLNVRDCFRQASELDGFFGRAHLFFDMGVETDAELGTALFLSDKKIKRGGLKRITVVEPMWTYPANYNASDPLNPAFYRPDAWYVNAKLVHRSRLLTFVGREVPNLLKPSYMFGGLSLSQMSKPYVDNWLRTRQSVSDLVHSFSVSGVATNLVTMLSAPLDSPDGLLARVALFNQTRDNRGMMLVDKDSEEFFNVSTPLSTLDMLQAQAQEQMAGVVGIPLVVLFGITPSGLNASSDGEIRTFYAWIHAQQEDLYTAPLKRTIDVIQLSEFGSIDPDITFSFVPLWQLDEAAAATVRKTEADTDAVYINEGVLDADDIRARLAAQPDGQYAAVDFSAPAPDMSGEEDASDPGTLAPDA